MRSLKVGPEFAGNSPFAAPRSACCTCWRTLSIWNSARAALAVGLWDPAVGAHDAQAGCIAQKAQTPQKVLMFASQNQTFEGKNGIF